MAKRSAFSLIEVVIAVAVFGIAVTIFSQSIYNGLLSIDISRQRNPVADDITLIRTQILKIEKKEEIEKGGDITTYNSGLASWSCSVKDTETVDLMHISLVIDFKETKPPITENEELYVYRKDWMSPSKRNAIIEDKKAKFKSND